MNPATADETHANAQEQPHRPGGSVMRDELLDAAFGIAAIAAVLLALAVVFSFVS